MDILEVMRKVIIKDFPHITEKELEERLEVVRKLLKPVQDR